MSENKLIRCMNALTCEPWLLTPAMHKTLCEIVAAHIHRPQEQHAAAAQFAPKAHAEQYQIADNGVAVIPVDGVIGRKFSTALYSSGVTSVDVLARQIDKAAANPEIKGIVLLFDSPGGGVQGVAEAGMAVKRATEKKRVISYADGLMASAAYWIGSQADAIYSWAESSIGSIGVYSYFLDVSRQFENKGLKMEVFKSGEHKGMGMPGTSLSDEQRKMLQDRVDEIGVQFRATVQAGRGRVISEAVMQGQSFQAEAAKLHGLIDCIATIEEAIRDAAGR